MPRLTLDNLIALLSVYVHPYWTPEDHVQHITMTIGRSNKWWKGIFLGLSPNYMVSESYTLTSDGLTISAEQFKLLHVFGTVKLLSFIANYEGDDCSRTAMLTNASDDIKTLWNKLIVHLQNSRFVIKNGPNFHLSILGLYLLSN